MNGKLELRETLALDSGTELKTMSAMAARALDEMSAFAPEGMEVDNLSVFMENGQLVVSARLVTRREVTDRMLQVYTQVASAKAGRQGP